MGNLTSKARGMLPKTSFGLPGQRDYPIPDKAHAANAKARATQAVDAGRMGKSTEAKIDAKANRVLGEHRQTTTTGRELEKRLGSKDRK